MSLLPAVHELLPISAQLSAVMQELHTTERMSCTHLMLAPHGGAVHYMSRDRHREHDCTSVDWVTTHDSPQCDGRTITTFIIYSRRVDSLYYIQWLSINYKLKLVKTATSRESISISTWPHARREAGAATRYSFTFIYSKAVKQTIVHSMIKARDN